MPWPSINLQKESWNVSPLGGRLAPKGETIQLLLEIIDRKNVGAPVPVLLDEEVPEQDQESNQEPPTSESTGVAPEDGVDNRSDRSSEFDDHFLADLQENDDQIQGINPVELSPPNSGATGLVPTVVPR